MSCEQWRDQLDAYADDAAGDFASLEEHLRTCPACTSAVLARIQLKRATRAAAAGRYTPSPAFRLKIEKSIAAKKPRRRFSVWIPSLAGALAALLVVAISVGVWMRHQAREQSVAQLLDMHVATVGSPNPVDVVSTDRHTVKPWFAGKLPFTFNVPELANTPYKLLGGKLVYIHDQPAAQLLFELRKHQLSVFISQEQNRLLPAGESDTHANGFTVETWAQDGLRYAIISDTSQSDVNELGNLLKTAR